MWVVIESGGAWHIVILQPTGVELITVIISHSISGQKPSQSTWLDQSLSSGTLRVNYVEGRLLGLFSYRTSAFGPPLWFGLFFILVLQGWQLILLLLQMTIRYLGKLTGLLINTIDQYYSQYPLLIYRPTVNLRGSTEWWVWTISVT